MSYPHLPAFTPDINLRLKDSGLIDASAAAQVGGSAAILDLWPSGVATFQPLDIWINVTAIEIASNDELYTIRAQVSSSATFASVIHNVGALELGALEVNTGGSADQDGTTGTYMLRVDNDVAGTVYRYMRLFTTVSGTVATGINYDAWGSLV